MDFVSLGLKIVLKIPNFCNWIRYRRYIKVVRELKEYEKNILDGLCDSPMPLQLYQAYKKSVGQGTDIMALYSAQSEQTPHSLIEKKLIFKKNEGYVLTKEAEYAIARGALKIVN
ncbi:MAG: hypothetical protein ACE14U_05815 [Candidatus Velamenicoccus archaeovorus]